MKKEELDKLLERFYNAETTHDEEAVLIAHFSGGGDDKEYRAESEYFSMLASASASEMPDAGFDERIMSSLPPEESRKTFFLRPWIVTLISSAAVVISGVLLFTNLLTGTKEQSDTFSDPYLAYAEAVKTLTMVGNNLNQGLSAGNQTFQEVGKVTDGALKSVTLLNDTKVFSKDKLQDISYLKKTTSRIRLDEIE